SEAIRFPEDHAVRRLLDGSFAFVAVMDQPKVTVQIEQHLLKLIALVGIGRYPRLIDVDPIHDQIVILAVFTRRVDLLLDRAILFLSTRVTAVNDDMRSRRQRTV